jgi:glucan 1,3-beta-glucosidase
LHAAPGSQNKDSHSGTSGGQVKFWSPSNLASTLVALRLLASQISKIPNVVGLELFNEPANNNALQGWYERVIPELRNITGSEFPIYISDAWDLQWYAQLVGKRDDFTVVDHHLYRCFTPADHAMSGDAHAQAIRTSTFSHLQDMSQKAHGNIVIGEYSSALNPASVGHNSPAGEQDRQRRVFSQAQLETYEKCCAGAFFWTYKKENGWDAGWSLKDTMRAEIMPLALGKPRMERRESTIEAKRRSEETAFGEFLLTCRSVLGNRQTIEQSIDTHKKYWSSRPGHYEHWRFDRGFSRGWDDAYAFFDFEAGSSVSELGFKGEWTRRRVREHAKESGVGANMWEFGKCNGDVGFSAPLIFSS